MSKKAQINFLIDPDLKDQFNKTCRDNWDSGASILRKAVLDYIKLKNEKK